ncbi:uncharacterized protein IL334_002208 [Kwoniella shivajii]|uniref:Telomeric single stranded DNA binding POT1/Cdc13 domain-containing protein n=1 Tax=Kwoniella shivajii TaxID=564305 RepID=A0ABZ1CUD7_9TREE|nr:hypothetical protein IL334_002208 [Kwoniella shivajii]
MTRGLKRDADFPHSASTPVDHSHFVPGTILPFSHLEGKILIFWGDLQANLPRLAFSVTKTYDIPIGYRPIDYILPTENAKKEKYEIKLILHHSHYNENFKDEKLKDQIRDNLLEDKAWLKTVSKSVMIDTSQMKVLKKEYRQDVGDYMVELQGVGERIVRYDSGSTKRILSDTIKPSQAPDWFTSSAPTVSSPVQPTSQLLLTAPMKNGESSRLKPLTSHQPPDLTRIPSKSSSTSSHTSNPSRPAKRSSDILENDISKKTKEKDNTSDQSDGSAKGKGKEQRTVVQLGPPGYQSFIGHRDALPTKLQDHDMERQIEVPGSSTETCFDEQTDPQLFRSENIEKSIPPVRESTIQQSHPLPEAELSDPLQEAESFRSRSYDPLRPDQAASSPSVPSRGQSIPYTSQSSPSVFTPKVQRDRIASARRQAEENRRNQVQAAQAASEKVADERTADISRLEKPFHTRNVEYTPLRYLQSGQYANVIGAVVKVTPVSKPKDYLMNVIICDPTRHSGGPANSNEEFVISIFRSQKSDLPSNASVGCVFLFRHLKISTYNEKTKGQSFSGINNNWAIMLRGKEIKTSSEELSPPLIDQEVDRMKDLWRWWKGIGGEDEPQGFDTPSPRRSSTGLGISKEGIALSQILPGMFIHATFKIMQVIRNTHRKPDLEMYITDGTTTTLHPKNFHGVRIPGLPAEALFCIAIHDLPQVDELQHFETGKFLRLENVRGKVYQGEFELIWSELPTSDQAQRGWRRRKCTPIDKEDETARMIEKRLVALKVGESVDEPVQLPHHPIPLPSPTQLQPITYPLSERDRPNQPLRLATHITTTHTDPTNHPISTIAEILANTSLPNKYRMTARIKSLHPRSIPENSTFVQPYCKHCHRAFKGTWCQSCGDTEGTNAEWRYRFIAILEDQDGGEMACVVADDDAAFLPGLPPWSNSNNPNDARKSQSRCNQITGEVCNILQGARMDGVRTTPFIDMSLEVYEVDKASVTRQKEGTVVVARMFGMTAPSQ